MNTLSVPSCIRFRQLTRMFFAACAVGSVDRSDTGKIADVLKGKTKQDILTCAGAPRRESTSQGLTAMVYQKEAGLVELSVPGAKSSGARSVPHRCRATVILKDGRVIDVRYESVPEWLGAENHCEEIFAGCSQ